VVQNPLRHRLNTLAVHAIRAAAWFVGGVLAVYFFALVGFRIFGLPASWQKQVRQTLAARHIYLDYGKLYLDQKGSLVMLNAALLNPGDRAQKFCEVDRVECGVRWLAWWRNEPFLEHIQVRNAKIVVPLDTETSAVCERVSARVKLTRDEVEIEFFEADILKFHFSATGRVGLKSVFQSPKTERDKGSEKGLSSVASAWRKFKTWNEEVQLRKPVQIAVELDRENGEGLQAISFEAICRVDGGTWRGVEIKKTVGTLVCNGGEIRIPEFKIRTGRGDVTLAAKADLNEKQGMFAVESTLDPSLFSGVLDGYPGAALGSLSFKELPRTQAKVDFAWKEGFWFSAQGDVDWRNFECGGSAIKRLQIPLSCTNGRVFVPDARLDAGDETLLVKLIYERDNKFVKASVKGSLDPTKLKSVAPIAAHPFLNSCQFTKGLNLQAELVGASFQPLDWKVTGEIEVLNAHYKGVAITRLKTGFDLNSDALKLSALSLARPEGTGLIGEGIFHFKTRCLSLKETRCKVHLQQTAKMFGGNFERSCQPYVFEQPPDITVSGVADLGNGPNTNLLVKVRGGAMTYPFFGVLLPITKIVTDLHFKERGMAIQSLDAGLYSGVLVGTATFDFSKPQALFKGNLKTDHMDFGQVMQSLFKVENTSGTMNGQCQIAGVVGQMETLTGHGQIEVQDGYLLSIPFMGGLSSFLGTLIPDFGSAKAKNARSSFTIRNGAVRSGDIDLRSFTFSMIANGEYNFIRDDLSMDARVNLRGVAGLVLFPVSKLFEYHGSGPLKNPRWTPKMFGD